MSFPPVTEMFQFTGFASPTYGFSRRSSLRMGLPHSEIHGSTGARPSPWLIAACYVLHRLSVPRHPPDALIDAWSQADHVPHGEEPPVRQPDRSPETRSCASSHPHVPSAENGRTARPEAPRSFVYPYSRCPTSGIEPHDGSSSEPWSSSRNPVSHLRDTATAHGPGLVEADGIEPTTPCLQSRCSPS